jgi:hypothetical protein
VDRWTYVYEPVSSRLSEAAIAVVTCACAGGIATFDVSGIARYVLGAATALTAIWAVHRSFRVGLWVNQERVRVRNYWITREFGWGDVDSVFIGALVMGFVPQPAWCFSLKSGGLVRVRATPSSASRREADWRALKGLAPKRVTFTEPPR